MRAQARRPLPRTFAASAFSAPDTAPPSNTDEPVSAKMFAEFVRKCGLTKPRLHKKLYPLNAGRCAPKGVFPIAVAVSGGADSMALMLLLKEYLHGNRIKTPLLAVTVDHQLRLESSKEALDVAKICAERGGIKHMTKVCEWHPDGVERKSGEGKPVKPRDSKMEEQARQYRYSLLRQVCQEYRVRWLFVAHNRGDQLETTLFRLGRASGINGLAGIANRLPFYELDELLDRHIGGEDPEADTTVTLARPLLSATKDQLMATCDRFNQTWMHDPANDDLAYDRVRIRQWQLSHAKCTQALERVEREQGPEILNLFSRFQQTAAKAKKEFARAERAILRKYSVTFEPNIVVMRIAFFHDPNMFDELLYRVLSIIIVLVGNKETPPRLASVVRLVEDLQRLETGKQVTLGGCRPSVHFNFHVVMGKKSELVEVAPVPGFFGYVVKPGHPLKWSNEVEDFCMQLNSAALGADATNGRSTLSVVAKTSKIALCTLTPEVAEQWNLTQTFTPMDGAIEFVVDGPNAIHLTGFIEVEEEEDSGDEHDFDDLGSDEDEMMVFGGDDDSSDDDVDEDEEEEVELNDEAKKNRFEVLEERSHNEPETKKKSPKKEAKKAKEETKKTKEATKKEAAVKKEAAAAAEAEKKAKEEKEAAKKKAKAAKQAEKEKKTAEKLAEVTASNPKGKKRAAPAESVDVPKKAKVATRVHKGVTIEDVAVGKGRPVMRGRKVGIVYRGRLTNGKQFDATQNRKKPFTFRHGIGDVIKGMDIGIEGMRVGSKRTITIPSRLGYGREGAGPTIPGNSDLIFEIEVVNA
ncbi:FK506-binding protein 4 [Phytophthora citrophthora]|uniref:peptidylprolyl isomerase n=1 Tax=Phytophthora citrophthora TaxID=4793 RepID=A0AAD9GZL5_9STRA|nr:FK506-binding protein 4 [Phytophthora citrophthora]